MTKKFGVKSHGQKQKKVISTVNPGDDSKARSPFLYRAVKSSRDPTNFVNFFGVGLPIQLRPIQVYHDVSDLSEPCFAWF